MSRVVSWFSCGAASAVATKLAIESSQMPVEVVRIWLAEEHEDNDRFAYDCAKWFGQTITVLKSVKYDGSVLEVIRKRRYINGPSGAPCTVHLKKDVRRGYQRPDDLQVFGYTSEEQDRYDRFLDANPNVRVLVPLIDRGLSHSDCLAMVQRAGIELPTLYKLGYKHNNCIGCVKGQAGYWNKVRIDFPTQFDRMAKAERQLGSTAIRLSGKKVFLDELPPDAGRYPEEPEIQCGINCEIEDAKLRGQNLEWLL